MVRTIKAKFFGGVFQPLEPAVNELVREGEEVIITIATVPHAGDPLLDTAGGWRGLVDADCMVSRR